MKNRTSSPLGYILDYLCIPTSSIATALHVDPSLVSKWKSGSRSLTSQSVYFQDIIDYILDFCSTHDNADLPEALSAFHSHGLAPDVSEKELARALKQIISSPNNNLSFPSSPSANRGMQNSVCFIGSQGQRAAISTVLDDAEQTSSAGEIVLVESEDFSWLLEDEAFSSSFLKRLKSLIKRGCHVKFIIHYTSYKNQFIEFFLTFSDLLFNRNVEWFYYDDYSKNMVNVSIFILNKAVSLISISANGEHTSTTLCQDASTILQHQRMVDHIISGSHPMYNVFQLKQLSVVLNDLQHFRKSGNMYCILSAPAFFTANPYIITRILEENHIPENKINEVLELSEKARSISENYFEDYETASDSFIFVFHLEKMIHRAENPPFISRSLSLACGKEITVSPKYYALQLRSLAHALERYSNFQIVLASSKARFALPHINCWCRQNTWMLQMDKKGYRISEELEIINAVSTYFEGYIRSIPPRYRDKSSVISILSDLADRIDHPAIP